MGPVNAAAGAIDLGLAGAINPIAPAGAAAESLLRNRSYEETRKKWMYTPTAGTAAEGADVLNQTIGRAVKPIAGAISGTLQFAGMDHAAAEDLANTGLAALPQLLGRRRHQPPDPQRSLLEPSERRLRAVHQRQWPISLRPKPAPT